MERDGEGFPQSRSHVGGTRIMDEMFNMFDSESTTLNCLSDSISMPRSYTSCIKFAGRPILPPIMTVERYEEMAMYKRQAIFTETRLKTRCQQKLLARVQTVVDSISKRPSAFPGVELDSQEVGNRADSMKTSANPPRELSSDTLKDDPLSGSGKQHESIPETSSLRAVADRDKEEKVSPRSDVTKDSGISSVVPSVTPSFPQELELQDTMAEITDISDEDSDGESGRSKVLDDAEQKAGSHVQRRAQYESVADRIRKAFMAQTDSEPLLVQTSAQSSTSGTTSTASTDDTLMNYTVVARDLSNVCATTDPSKVSSELDIENSMPTQDEVTEKTSSGVADTGLVDFHSSLLSKVAMDPETGGDSDSDLPEEGETAGAQGEEVMHRVGDLSRITLTSSQKVVDEERPKETQVVVDQRENEKNLQTSVIKPKSSCTSNTSDTGKITPQDQSEPEGIISNDISPPSKDQNIDLSGTDNQESHFLSANVPTSNAEQEELQLPSRDNSGMITSPQNVSDSSTEQGAKSENNSTMYTASTDLDKYMAGSMDTIKSSMTTLPHILDDVTPVPTDEDIRIVPQEKSEGFDISEDISNVSEMLTQKGHSSTIFVGDTSTSSSFPPRPTFSTAMPNVSAPSPKDNLRRGSYTLDSPSPALLLASEKPDFKHAQTALVQKSDIERHELKGKAQSLPKKLINNSKPEGNDSCITKPKDVFEMTSSMEDLKLKPVQRTLNFDEEGDERSESTSVPHSAQVLKEDCRQQQACCHDPIANAKEEHLRRYLQNLGHMPAAQRLHQSQPVGAEPGICDTGSSPGQVNLCTESAPGGVLNKMDTGMSTKSVSIATDCSSLTRSLQTEFDALQQSLVDQQQAQLGQLLMEQKHQQLLMQQEFLKHEAMLLSSGSSSQEGQLQKWQEKQLLELREKQAQLMQQHLTMQHQMKCQMQQQQTELLLQSQAMMVQQQQQQQKQQPQLYQSGLQATMTSQQNGKKRRRKTWQEQQGTELLVAQQQVESNDFINTHQELQNGQQPFSDRPGALPSISNHILQRKQGPYFASIATNLLNVQSDDTLSGSCRSNVGSEGVSGTSSSVNRSGVPVSLEPDFHNYKPQTGGSPESVHTNPQHPQHGKKRVSFSDMDTVTENGSVTSRSTSSQSVSHSGLYTETGGPYYKLGNQYFPVPSIEPVPETGEYGDVSVLSCDSSSPARLVGGVYVASPISSCGSRTPRSNRASPRTPRHIAMAGPKLTLNDTTIPVDLQKKFERVSAAVKGYLTRRLMRSDKVQQIIKTVTDTAEFAMNFQCESPIKKGIFSMQDKELVERVIAQLTAALYEIHEIFFEIPIPERMALIAQTRMLEREKLFKQQERFDTEKKKRLSSATLKAIERKKKARAAEMAAFGDVRSLSAPPNTSSPKGERHSESVGPLRRHYQSMMSRVLKPIQTQLSPIKPVKDTLNRNPLRRSNQYMYSRAIKRAVVEERKEQERVGKIKANTAIVKRAKTKVVSGTHGVRKPTAGSSPGGAPNKRSSALVRPQTKPVTTHPWK